MRRLIAVAVLAVACSVTPTAAGADESRWGNDINAGDGPALAEAVAGDLAAIVAASDDARPAVIAEFVEKRAPVTIEAVKRFRNPELRDLFRALLATDDWKLQHRALLALEHYEDKA